MRVPEKYQYPLQQFFRLQICRFIDIFGESNEIFADAPIFLCTGSLSALRIQMHACTEILSALRIQMRVCTATISVLTQLKSVHFGISAAKYA